MAEVVQSLRISEELHARIVAWTEAQVVPPTYADALRFLLDAGLKTVEVPILRQKRRA